VLILETRHHLWPDEAACASWAQGLAQHLAVQSEPRSAYIELRGELGAGKTTLVRHLLHALGVQGRIKSPTYAVMEPHLAPGLAIAHFDFYRFSNAREWADAGFRDVFAAPGLKLAEWPEKAAPWLPLADLRINILVHDDAQRQVTVHALTNVGQSLLP
jgi:tRNA threonylcarbamoyladenosine biosynthesis protein TsaE